MRAKFFLLVMTTFFAAVSYGQKNVISMLNDRFSFSFPDSAVNQARGTDIMSADPNTNIETRVVLNMGSKRMVFFAEDLLVKSTDNLEARLKGEATKEFPFVVKKKDNLDSTVCYSITPQKFATQAEAILINSMVIKNADSTLSRLSVYVNPAAFKDKPTFDNITDKVFASFKKGARRLNLAARTERFTILKTKTKYDIKLPENYIVTLDKKYDFEVYKIQKVNTYGDTSFAEMLMYFGFHPSYAYKELQLDNFRTSDAEGEYMFHKFKWPNYKDPNRNLYLREEIFDDEDIQKGAQNHIAMITNSEKNIEELALILKNSLLIYDK